jgi:hypothetical protein
MAPELVIRRDGTIVHRTNVYIDLELKRRAKKAGINITRFTNDALRTYVDLYGTSEPSGDALADIVHRAHAHRIAIDTKEEDKITRLLAERENREREKEQRRRDDAAVRLEAIIRQAEMELATLRGAA